jgi:hypothetical protein
VPFVIRVNNEKSGRNDNTLANTFFGYQAGNVTTSGNNTAIGNAAMKLNTTGTNNVAVGKNTLTSNTTGSNNTAYGLGALSSNRTNSRNTAVGTDAMFTQSYLGGNTDNVAVGYQSLYSNQPTSSSTGYRNVALGTTALYSNSTGLENTASGHQSLLSNTTGNYNTAHGTFSLYSSQTGSNNTAVGYKAFYSGAAFSNSMALGANATSISASNQVQIGNSSVDGVNAQVGITVFSDARVKNNIRENVPGISFIEKLRPVSYFYDIDKEDEITGSAKTPDWDGKYDIEKIQFTGFLAQEVDEAARKIGYDFSGVDKKGKLLGLRYSEFVVPLVKAVQEQQIQIAAQQKLIEEMKNEFIELKKEIEKLKESNH